MNVTYEHKPAMTFIGFFTSIRPEEGYQNAVGDGVFGLEISHELKKRLY
nr:hypothetical protein [Frisingicoccus sp.]